MLSLNKFKLNSHGSVLVMVMGVLSVTGIISFLAIQYVMSTNKAVKYARVKNSMLEVETKLKILLYESSSYTLFEEKTATATSPVLTFKNTLLSNIIIKPFPGAQCPAGITDCGIEIIQKGGAPFWNSASLTFTGQIVYTGIEVALAPIDVIITVPAESVNAQKISCPPATPFLTGFKPNGEAICAALPSIPCQTAGEYLSYVNNSLITTCSPLAQDIDCGLDNFLTNVVFQGAFGSGSGPAPSPAPGGPWSYSCGNPRIDPYSDPSMRPY